MKEHIRAVIDEMVAKKEHKKNNGPIELTADQLWKYSGKVEPDTVDYALHLESIKSWKDGITKK
tara:strand:+ start:191 stop:382 length:192 start_codon:yes stop_codon:yes gene_type:complete